MNLLINIKKPDINLTLLHNSNVAGLSTHKINLSKILLRVVPALENIKSQALENAPNLASEEDEDENLRFLHYTVPQERRFRKSPLRPFWANIAKIPTFPSSAIVFFK